MRALVASALVGLGCAGCAGTDHAPIEQRDVAALVPSAVLEPAPELKKHVPAPFPPFKPKTTELSYVFEHDWGIRTDDGGQGHFLAPRAHGKHNGVDFLAPVGTPILAACSGKARSDQRGGYGRIVQLVCRLPKSLGGDEGLHASFFYAHLDKASVPKTWTAVKAAQRIGVVGKTGNASGPKIKPHLHLEVIVRGSEEDALAETHSGVVREAREAADRFFELLAEECLEPAAFNPAHGEVRRERRADPFVLLMCAARPKPELRRPDDRALMAAQEKWSTHYAAKGFDVDVGPR